MPFRRLSCTWAVARKTTRCSAPNPLRVMTSFSRLGQAQLDTEALVQLLNQMIIKYESKLFPVLEPCFMQLLQKFMDLMPKQLAGPNQTGASHISAMILVLQRHYFVVIQHMVSHDLAAVMLSDRNLSHLDSILTTIVTGVVEVGAIRKLPMHTSRS